MAGKAEVEEKVGSERSERKERILAAELRSEEPGRTVRLLGWVHHVRDLGGVAFVVLRDRSGIAQVVLEKDAEASLPGAEDVIEVVGAVRLERRAPGGVEVKAESVTVLASAAADLPFSLQAPFLGAKATVGLDVRLDHRPFALRHPQAKAVFRVQSVLARGFGEFLSRRGFLAAHTPKIVRTGTEGGAALFKVDYFGQDAYLAQSPQFFKQMLVGAGFERVWEVGPVFRAEEHDTSRHLNEYTSMDLEMGFIQGPEDLMDLETELLRYLLDLVDGELASELATLGATLPALPPSGRIPRIDFAEAVRILRRKAKGGPGEEDNPTAEANLAPEGDLEPQEDLTPGEERVLGRIARERHGSDFVFVTGFPAAHRPFYTMPDQGRPGYTLGFDLLARGMEVTTGGQRIHDYGALVASMRVRGLKPEEFGAYLEVFRLGMPPHGGLAIGLERLTAQFLQLGNIREATLFPRDRSRLEP